MATLLDPNFACNLGARKISTKIIGIRAMNFLMHHNTPVVA